ncbi:hypothetical protein MMPV_009756 [Pyropia vietnamensis]
MASRRERHADSLGDYVPVAMPASGSGSSGGGVLGSFSGGGGGGGWAPPPSHRGGGGGLRGLAHRLFPVACSRAAAVVLVAIAAASAGAAVLLLALDGTVVLQGSLPAAADYEALMARADRMRAACETYASRARASGGGGKEKSPMGCVQRTGGVAEAGSGREWTGSALRPPPAAFCGGRPGCGGVTWGFLMVGDWGRHGACCTRDVAAEMAAAATALQGEVVREARRRGSANGTADAPPPPAWVVSTGDNFYASGVDSVRDEAVTTSWTDVFIRPHPALAALPWQIVLGNHDYEGNVSAAFDIGRVHPQWHARRELYYTKTVTLPRAAVVPENGNGTVPPPPPPRQILFVFLDTTPLLTSPELLRLHYRLPAKAVAAITAAAGGGLTEWLTSVLSESSADWVVVVGHHPVESAGASSVAEAATRARLRAMIGGPLVAAAAAGVVYVSGHEHDVQHTVVDGVHYVVSGGGSLVEASSVRQPGTLFSVATHAFWGAVVTDEVLSLQVIDYAGRFVYQTACFLLDTKKLFID